MLFLIPHINYQTMSEWTIKTKKDEKRDKTRQQQQQYNKYTGTRDDDSSSKNCSKTWYIFD